jgi:hypothetical protein
MTSCSKGRQHAFDLVSSCCCLSVPHHGHIVRHILVSHTQPAWLAHACRLDRLSSCLQLQPATQVGCEGLLVGRPGALHMRQLLSQSPTAASQMLQPAQHATDVLHGQGLHGTRQQKDTITSQGISQQQREVQAECETVSPGCKGPNHRMDEQPASQSAVMASRSHVCSCLAMMGRPDAVPLDAATHRIVRAYGPQQMAHDGAHHADTASQSSVQQRGALQGGDIGDDGCGCTSGQFPVWTAACCALLL